jgi:hypothetical protein
MNTTLEKLKVQRVYKRGRPGFIKDHYEVCFTNHYRLAAHSDLAFKVERPHTLYLPAASLHPSDAVYVDVEMFFKNGVLYVPDDRRTPSV